MSDSRTGWSWDGEDRDEGASRPGPGPDPLDASASDGRGSRDASGSPNPWDRPGTGRGGDADRHGAGAASSGGTSPAGAGTGRWGTQPQWDSTGVQGPDQYGRAPQSGGGTQDRYGQFSGYGQYGAPGGPMGYGAAPRPGIIPLRPLSIGEIYEGAVQAIRTNPAVMFGATLVLYALLAVASAALTWLMFSSVGAVPDPFATDPFATDPVLPSFSVGAATGFAGLNFLVPLLSFLATTLLTGVLICSVSQAVLGRKVSFAQVWELVKPRFWRLVVQAILFGILSFVYLVAVLLVILVPFAGIVAATVDSGAGGIGWAIALVVLTFLALLPITLYLYGRLVFAPAAVALETDRVTGRPMGPVASFGRSWRLTKGSGWRVAGLLLLTAIIVAAVGVALALPVTLVTGLLAGTPTISLVVNSFLSTLINAVAMPFYAGSLALLYIDLRMRKEGLDVELARAAGVA